MLRLGLAGTAVLGVIWTAVSGSLVENAQGYISASVDSFRRGEEIRRLRAEALTLQGKYDALAASSGQAKTA